MADLLRLQRGVRQHQRFDPIATARRRRATGQRVDKIIDLEALRLGVALEEERQRLVAVDALRVGKGDRAATSALY